MEKPRLELSAVQILATALAAVAATVAASYLGVTGTVIGAAVASVVSAVGSAIVSHSLRSTHARVREVVPGRRTLTPAVEDERADAPPVLPAPRPRPRTRTRTRTQATPNPWRRVAIGSVTLFVLLLATVTGVEIVAGRPISDLVRGVSGSGTTLFGDTNNAADAGIGNVPTVTRTVTPSVVVTTPTITMTAPAVTETATPTISQSTSADGTTGAPSTAPASDAPTSSGTQVG